MNWKKLISEVGEFLADVEDHISKFRLELVMSDLNEKVNGDNYTIYERIEIQKFLDVYSNEYNEVFRRIEARKIGRRGGHRVV